MTHMNPVPESSGTKSEPQSSERKCSTCHEPMTVQRWEASDGGCVDYKYSCPKGHVEWVDGIDS